MKQNKQKNTEIYIKTVLDVSGCSRAVGQGMVFSYRRNLSYNHQPFHNRLLRVFYFLHLQFDQLQNLHERDELNTGLHVCCMIVKIQGVSLECNNFAHGKRMMSFSPANIPPIRRLHKWFSTMCCSSSHIYFIESQKS